jgi:hypothetical protein
MRYARLGIGALAVAAAAVVPLQPDARVARAADVPRRVGPGPVLASFPRGVQLVRLRIAPNRASSANTISLELRRGGAHLRGARVTMSFTMTGMAMAAQTFPLLETTPGVYSFTGRALVMGGTWGIVFAVTPHGGRRTTLSVLDTLRP